MEGLKILVFEYITGGGLNKEELPGSLAKEGLLMLQSLTASLAEVSGVNLTVMLDCRMQEKFSIPEPANLKVISPELDCLEEFNRLLPLCDAVWPVAPESGGVLETLCSAAEKAGRILLNSSTATVGIAGNKWLTYEELIRSGIPAVPTHKLEHFGYKEGEWMIKAVDGAGCSESFLISGQTDYEAIPADLEKSRYIVQPHLYGLKTSLSCLFKEGRGWLLSVNLQQFIVAEGRYKLAGLIVNISTGITKYLSLISAIAGAFPGLWGYAGIDLIETGDKLYVLEINPRLTSSFAGIQAATGINPARSVVELLDGDPVLDPNRDNPVNLILQ